MGFKRTKDLVCYEEGRKKMGFDRTKDLKMYEYTKNQSPKGIKGSAVPLPCLTIVFQFVGFKFSLL